MKPLLLLALTAGPAMAATMNVSLTADGSSRWYEYFSNAYAQIDQGFGGNPALDGFFVIDGTLGNGPADSQLGGGADVFPFEGNWSDIGTLTLSGTPTGSGTENFSILDAVFNFSSFIADDDSISNTGYSTALTGVTGNVQFTSGLVTSISFSSDVTFTYSHPMLGELPYNGTLTMDDDGFVLAVDDTNATLLGDLRYRWDATGTAAFSVVPEPSAALLAAAALPFLFRRKR